MVAYLLAELMAECKTKTHSVHFSGLLMALLCLTLTFFPKQFTVEVLNAVLSVSALAGMLCPPPWFCLSLFLLSPGLSFSCLPAGLGCRVLALGLSPKCHVRFVQMFWGLQWWNSALVAKQRPADSPSLEKYSAMGAWESLNAASKSQ